MSPADLQVLHGALLFAAPLLVAAVGELVVERAGMVNIGIEGMMLAGALGAWVGNVQFGAMGGVAAGVGAACLLGMVFAAVVVGFGADQIVTGTGINLLALGLTGVIYVRAEAAWGGAAVSGVWPMAMMGLAMVLMGGVYLFLRLTRGGLELVAIGEAPEAAEAAGVAVGRWRVGAILFGAACAGLAGSYLSTMRIHGFQENMTEGRGFLALALVIFGRWTVPGVLAAGVLFGVIHAVANRLLTLEAMAPVSRLLPMLPYVVSLLALAGAAGRSRAPAGLGRAVGR